MVAGKRPSRSIRAMHARRETDDEQPRVGITEGRHRLAEVIGLLVMHPIEKSGKSGTAPAIRIEGAAHLRTPHRPGGPSIDHGRTPDSDQKKRATWFST